MEEYCLIPLHGKYGEGKFAKVSPEDFKWLSGFRWYVDDGYARTNVTIKGKQVPRLMHRAVLYGMHYERYRHPFVDHKNGDRLDNRKSQLRIANWEESARNCGPKKNGVSLFKGVHKRPKDKKWVAAIRVNGGIRHLGCFKSEEEAAHAYDACARFYFGEFARTNFPEGECYSADEARRRVRILRRMTSDYIGVLKHPSRKNRPWRSSIRLLGQKIECFFATELEAAKHYDEMVKKYRLNRRINFP